MDEVGECEYLFLVLSASEDGLEVSQSEVRVRYQFFSESCRFRFSAHSQVCPCQKRLGSLTGYEILMGEVCRIFHSFTELGYHEFPGLRLGSLSDFFGLVPGDDRHIPPSGDYVVVIQSSEEMSHSEIFILVR